MKHFKIEGIILKRKNIGESDRLLTVFTRKFGKLSIKAPGVRKISSKRSAHIEPCNVTEFTLYKGKGMPLVIEAVTLEHFSPLKGDLHRVGYAYHLLELVDGLCPEGQEYDAIYHLLIDTLTGLSVGEDASLRVAAFERQIVTILGFYKPEDIQEQNLIPFIEDILERRLKTKRMLYRFA